VTDDTLNIPRTIRWQNGELILLDQRRLPADEIEICCRTVDDVYDAIRTLAIRGAPAIGVAAAFGLLVGLREWEDEPLGREILRRAAHLNSARPTAVNLGWALDRMVRVTRAVGTALYTRLEQEAQAIFDEDVASCAAIGHHGAGLIGEHCRILTHCNAGALATSGWGTALAPIYVVNARGLSPHVFVDETRPLLQGARLTAYELMRSGVACTLITDNMAASVMASGIDLAIVGADRVAANGDVANKIGTLNVAILCHHYGIPFYVACPRSTLDPAAATGAGIQIEHRHADEVTMIAGQRVAPEGAEVWNPAFDVTPNELVTAFITDAGIVTPPYHFT
jgi:methylthioribose-1-phosphate isomerase